MTDNYKGALPIFFLMVEAQISWKYYQVNKICKSTKLSMQNAPLLKCFRCAQQNYPSRVLFSQKSGEDDKSGDLFILKHA